MTRVKAPVLMGQQRKLVAPPEIREGYHWRGIDQTCSFCRLSLQVELRFHGALNQFLPLAEALTPARPDQLGTTRWINEAC